jgi:uncharacterized protein (DUF1330 family)
MTSLKRKNSAITRNNLSVKPIQKEGFVPGYVIANYTINDSEAFAKYPPAVGPTIAQYGGRLLVADRDLRAVEGSAQPVIAVIEFESVEAAQRW